MMLKRKSSAAKRLAQNDGITSKNADSTSGSYAIHGKTSFASYRQNFLNSWASASPGTTNRHPRSPSAARAVQSGSCDNFLYSFKGALPARQVVRARPHRM